MKLLQSTLRLILSLTISQVHGQTDLDHYLYEARVQEQAPLKPRRGYPDPLPFTETRNALISMHIPTIENPPSALSEMPRVDEIRSNWAHTRDGDVIYNITKWFPLDKMRADPSKAEERWVYYNQTSGYIIANADRFLQSSIYDYVKENLLRHGIIYRFSIAYIEIDDNLPLEIAAIEKSSYQTLMKYSGTGRSGEKVEFRNGEGEFSVETINERHDLSSFDIALHLEDQSQVKCCFYLITDQWFLHECGVSSAGKRRVLMVKNECQNWLGQLVHFPVEKDQFVKIPLPDSDSDPFGDKGRLEYYVGYKVPIDIVNFIRPLPALPEGADPFGEYELPEKYTRDRVDVTDLLGGYGVQAIAVFDLLSSMIVAYTTESNHSAIEELIMPLGARRYASFLVKLNFYEIDARDVTEEDVWRVEDLLAGNPVKLASAGCMTLSGNRSTLSDNESECQIELSRDEYNRGVVLGLDLKLDLPQLKLVKEVQLELEYEVPKIVKVASRQKGRVIVMMTNVTKIVDRDGK